MRIKRAFISVVPGVFLHCLSQPGLHAQTIQLTFVYTGWGGESDALKASE